MSESDGQEATVSQSVAGCCSCGLLRIDFLRQAAHNDRSNTEHRPHCRRCFQDAAMPEGKTNGSHGAGESLRRTACQSKTIIPPPENC